jgi:hypothetical protein
MLWQRALPMKSCLPLSLVLIYACASFGQSPPDDGLKSILVERIQRTYGIKIDSTENSLNDLLDVESRLAKCRQILDVSGVTANYLNYSDNELSDMLLRATECHRLNIAHGWHLNWQDLGFSKLAGADARIYAADRINRSYGAKINWLDYSLQELVTLEDQIIASLPSWARAPSPPAIEPVASLYHRLGLPAPELDSIASEPQSNRMTTSTPASRPSAVAQSRSNRNNSASNRTSAGYPWATSSAAVNFTINPGFDVYRNDRLWNDWFAPINFNSINGRTGSRLPQGTFGRWPTKGARIR